MKSCVSIGIMQGRLLPKYQNRYQAHPVGYWQDEFQIASSLGLSRIEFILDFNDSAINPLLKPGGCDEILKMTEKTGVKVTTVCADYFMEAPLHSENESDAARSKGILFTLLDHGRDLGLTDIVIPCVDQSSIRDIAAKKRFVKQIMPAIEKAEKNNINLSLETDFSPQPFAELLDELQSKNVTVNYDTGNSAALGYDPAEELNTYGARISDIHIKDRVLGGGSVELGTGNAQFTKFFDALKKINFTGPFIMQAYRDEEGIEIFKRQLEWVVNNHFNTV
jgi:L-ribulose-5-phosphate 3-epimerase